MNKQTGIAVLVFVALVCVVFLTRENKVEAGVTSISLPKFKTDEVVALEISRAQNVSLKKDGAGLIPLLLVIESESVMLSQVTLFDRSQKPKLSQ